MLLYLPDLFHSFLQDCTFVRFDVEVVNVVKIGEDQLGELLDVFVLMLTVALLVAPLGTAETYNIREINHQKKQVMRESYVKTI